MYKIVDDHPDDPRSLVSNIEFYITNVCNLNCVNCNRFNNHDFSGYQKWSDYKEIYAQWSRHIRLQRVTILGGEPLLNPTILDWIDGINELENQLVIYPNPATDEIKVSIEQPTNILVSDFNGKLLLKQVLQPGQALNLSDLKSGIYLIEAGDKKTKLIKN
jgi:organic radical activating enzyme